MIVYRRTREKMPAHDAELEEALQEGVLVKWLSTIREAGESSITVEKMRLDEHGMAQPTGEFETLEADSVVLALGQDVDLSLLDGVPGLEIDGGVVKVDVNMMTGHPGIFAGGDMVPGERTVTVGIGHGKLAARNIDAWLRGEAWTHPPRHELATLRQAQHVVLLGRAESTAPGARHGAPAVDIRGSGGRVRPRDRAVRGAALPELRQLLRVRQLLRRLPGQRRDQARRRASATRSTTTTARAAGCACRSARAARFGRGRRRSRKARKARKGGQGEEGEPEVSMALERPAYPSPS